MDKKTMEPMTIISNSSRKCGIIRWSVLNPYHNFKPWNYQKSTWTPLSRCKKVTQRLNERANRIRNIINNTSCKDIDGIILSNSLRWSVLQFFLIQHSLRDCLKSLLKASCRNEFNIFTYKSCCTSILEKFSTSFLYCCSQDIDSLVSI